MASTTSAAASMLRCTSSYSSTSQHQCLPNHVDQNPHTFNFMTNNAPTFYLPPRTSISTSQSHPTITLDFTTNSSSSSSSSSTHHTFSSQRYSSTPIISSSSSATNSSSSSFNSYTTLCNNFKNQIGGASYLGRPCFSHQPLMLTSKSNQTTTIEYSGEVKNSDSMQKCVPPRI
ncbi:hypothetical protein HAX54_043159 [Datura stramonium]|uniref:Uncharacterized protein n=1 Tax=Datura stramonium TaxID=4076 RepID=A0ABS8SMY4_DATST|nr:hypothetical protein [Datura stramonium]